MRKVAAILMVVVLTMMSLAGCSKSSAVTGAKKADPITITDSTGKTVTLASLPQRIVVTNSDVAEVICALGGADKIVGASDNAKKEPLLADKLKDAVSVGDWQKPSVEKIAELKPDVVFGYASYLDNAEQFKASNIPVVCLDCYKVDTLGKDITTLGQILNKEKEAGEYVGLMDKYLKIIESGVKSLKPEQKSLVYLESYSDYSTVAGKSGGNQMLNLAGAINIAGGEPVDFPKSSPEWLLSKNPQVVIKSVSSKVASGYGETDEGMKKMSAQIISRTGWKEISAVKEGRVYIISSEIYTGPQVVVGIAYFAKWFNPQLFADLDPEAIHNEILTKFHGVKSEGAWVFPEGK